MLVLPTLMAIFWKRRRRLHANKTRARISIISTRHVGRMSHTSSCAGANWSLMELTGKLCDVNPFFASYQPVQEIPVAKCCTVWTDQTDSIKYLLVGDQMLWFGTQMPNSLLNPNQMRAYGIGVYDDPFDTSLALLASTVTTPSSLSIPRGQLCISSHVCRLTVNGKRRTYRLYCLRVKIGAHHKKCCVTGTKAANSRKCGPYNPLHLG
jgi:hypothetical protein